MIDRGELFNLACYATVAFIAFYWGPLPALIVVGAYFALTSAFLWAARRYGPPGLFDDPDGDDR